MMAAFLSLKSFLLQIENKHVLLQTDNTTVVAYVNNMGGSRSVGCDRIAREIWFWCIAHNVMLTATHIAGVTNTVADRESRNLNDRVEWQLNQNVFQRIMDEFGPFDIDLFASRLNKKVDQ